MARMTKESAKALLARDPLRYFTPTPTQEQFLRRDVADWASLISSVSRGGKSTISCVDLAWTLRGIHPYRPNHKNIVIIQFVPSRLQAANVIGSKLFKKSELLLPSAPPGVADIPMIPSWEIEKLNEPNVAGMKVPYECIMKNGNRLLFSWAGVDGIAKRIAGLKVDAAYVDENAGTPALFQELYPRLLDSQSDPLRPGLGYFVWSNTNVDYNEEYEAFVDRAKRGVVGHKVFIIGKHENPAIDQNKRELMKEVMSSDAARIRMDGDMTAGDLVGIYTKQWQDERHLLPTAYNSDPEDNLWVGYDPGVDHPMGMLVVAINKNMPLRLVVAKCWSYRGETIEKDANNLQEWLQGRKISGFVYDTNLNNRDRGGGPTVLARFKELLQNRGIVPLAGFYKSKKNHTPGIALMRHYLDPNPDNRHVPPLLMLAKPDDENGTGMLRQQILKYRGNEATKFRGAGGVVKKDDDLLDPCFIAGTMITTQRGEVPIEDVTTEDMAWTVDGWRPVIAAAKTGDNRPVFTLTTETGESVTGTGNHPIWVCGKGWIPLDHIRSGDMVSVCINKHATIMSHSTESQTPKEALGGRIEKDNSYTASSGSMRSDQSQKVLSSTTRMETQITTNSATSCFAPISNTPQFTGEHHPNRLGMQQPSGMGQKKALHGTVSKVLEPGQTESQRSANVKTADLSMKDSWDTSAATPVSQHLEKSLVLTTKHESVSSAALSFLQTNTQKPALAPVRVKAVCRAGLASVYNLSVDGRPEYLANGIRVHNCRYLINQRPSYTPLWSCGQMVTLSTNRVAKLYADDKVPTTNMSTQAAPQQYDFMNRVFLARSRDRARHGTWGIGGI